MFEETKHHDLSMICTTWQWEKDWVGILKDLAFNRQAWKLAIRGIYGAGLSSQRSRTQ